MALTASTDNDQLGPFKELPRTPRKGRACGRKTKMEKKRPDITALVRPHQGSFLHADSRVV